MAAATTKRSRTLTILVCGASGGCGSAVVRLLSANGSVQVRALVRDLEKDTSVALGALPNVDLVKGDYLDTESLRHALEGADRVFLTSPNNPEQAAMEKNLVSAANAADVTYLVKVSTCAEAVAKRSPVSYGCWHWEIEQALESSDMKFTCLYPTYFMKNMCFFYGQSVKESSSFKSVFRPNDRVSMIDPEDVGASAASLLLMDDADERTHHRHYKLSGPAAITQGEVATTMGEVLGRTITYEPISTEEYVGLLKSFGFFPEWLISALRQIMLKCREQNYVTNDVEFLTGKPATTMREFFIKNKASFMQQ